MPLGLSGLAIVPPDTRRLRAVGCHIASLPLCWTGTGCSTYGSGAAVLSRGRLRVRRGLGPRGRLRVRRGLGPRGACGPRRHQRFAPSRRAASSVEEMSSTEAWLRARTDSELAELLTARPDVMLPAPPDLLTLARRLDSSATVRRAVAGCTAFDLQILQAMWALGGPAAPDGIATFLGGPATAADVQRAMERLHTIGLIRSSGERFVLGPTTGEALGRFPAGLGNVAG